MKVEKLRRCIPNRHNLLHPFGDCSDTLAKCNGAGNDAENLSHGIKSDGDGDGDSDGRATCATTRDGRNET